MENAHASLMLKNITCPEQNDRKRSRSMLSDGETDHSEPEVKDLVKSEDKKWKRVMANRISAKESRDRRKQLLTDLAGSVQTLSNENAILAAENAELRKQLACLLPKARANSLTLANQAHQLQLATQRSPSDLLQARSHRPSLLNTFPSRRSLVEAGLLRQQMKLLGLDV